MGRRVRSEVRSIGPDAQDPSHQALFTPRSELKTSAGRSDQAGEHKLRLKAEADAQTAKAHLDEANLKLVALQSEKEQLEMDLMEAASQILKLQALLTAIQGGNNGGLTPWQSVKIPTTPTLSEERGKRQSGQLQTIASKKDGMAALKTDSRHWEELHTFLQDTCPDIASSGSAEQWDKHEHAERRRSGPIFKADAYQEMEPEIVPGWNSFREAAMHKQSESEYEDEMNEVEEEEDEMDAKNRQIMEWMESSPDTAVQRFVGSDDGMSSEFQPNILLSRESCEPAAPGLGAPRTRSEGQEMLEAIAKLLLANGSPDEDDDEVPNDLAGLASVGTFIARAKHSAKAH